IDHLALALARTVAMSMATGPVMVPKLCSVAHQIRDLGAPNLILTGQAVDVGTGAPDIPALHDGSPSPGSRHLPSQELATLAAAEDQDFKPFWLSHALLCLCRLSIVLHRGGQTPRGTERGERGCDSLPLAQGAARQKHAALVEALRGHVMPHSAHAPSGGRRCASKAAHGAVYLLSWAGLCPSKRPECREAPLHPRALWRALAQDDAGQGGLG